MWDRTIAEHNLVCWAIIYTEPDDSTISMNFILLKKSPGTFCSITHNAKRKVVVPDQVLFLTSYLSIEIHVLYVGTGYEIFGVFRSVLAFCVIFDIRKNIKANRNKE
jgi:hypothetical protein